MLQLFELLGFDRFEFIQDLIQNRRKIIDSSLRSDSGVSDRPAKASPRLPVEPTRPNYGCQVTIQVFIYAYTDVYGHIRDIF